ncbi:MAG: DUF2497 domain-containing protein [Alphaproteobacteria bacterium]|nr:DUF2497 domain-containing protein [Alphaproteobacteria bacterium]
MDETKKDDMSTEQILSSIRNILTDENGEEIVQPAQVVEADEVKEDVFELSSEMIVGEEEQSEPYDLSAMQVFQEAKAEEEEVLDLDEADVIEEEISEPKPEPEVEPELEAEEEIIDVAEVVVEKNVEKPVLEDVSANIMSAFANLFNNYTPVQRPALEKKKNDVSYEKGELLSEVGKAAESWVLKNINQDVKIEEIVREEIALQVRVWLDENLPSLIQSSINEELERVMVKVDNAQ